MSLRDAIAQAVSTATGRTFDVDQQCALGGGCINQAMRLEGAGQRYFVKLNAASRLDMFAAEADGLREIASTRSVRVPQPICRGTYAGQSYLVLEYLELANHSASSDERLGHQLAAMHRHTSDRFGWRRSNTIGSTPQINTREHDWPTFFREHRLRYQLDLATNNGYGEKLQSSGKKLLDRLPAFFTNYRPAVSLLHGDLWGGNHASLSDGSPVIFDPAVYYGDREADLAMTELFGGYGAGFYAAYRESWPLDSGYPIRRDLYNLYHVLNHLNLFGGGYRGQALQLIDRLLSAT